ncbi:TatD family deoxyribonuclease [Candidatus Woesearchaeota archaeon]|nr:MAG: TatD family deoxyribonuclease [Candidatus Woesearchaeota archaeon]
MHLIDDHCHLDDPSFQDDLDAVIARAKKAGVAFIVSNGTDPASNERVLNLAKRYDIVKPALGIYPTTAARMTEPAFLQAHSLIKTAKPIAIGEVGLDHKEVTDEEEQAVMEARFLALARTAQELNIPLIVHSRKAEERCISLLETIKARNVVMHCFCGKKRLVQRVAHLGWYFSIPATIVRSEHFQNIARSTPLTRLLTETDSPYLSPTRDRNEPANVIHAVHAIAAIKDLTPEETANHLFMNFQRVFLSKP